MADPWDLPLLEFASKAERDLRKLAKRNRADAMSIRDALDELRSGATNIDVKPVQGHPPWWRLRVGDWRILYRTLTSEEVLELCRRRQPALTEELGRKPALPRNGTGLLVFRIVNRRDLERAAGALP
jgi:mRNA-degrading endonuclease RelE of RelBE toxin-antitoxin system